MKTQLKTLLLIGLLLAVIASLTIPLQQQFARAAYVFSDGFESGDDSAWLSNATSNGAFVVNTDHAFEGYYSGKFKTLSKASGTSYAYVIRNYTGAAEYYSRAYVYIAEGLPLDDESDRFTFMTYYNGGTALCSCQVEHADGIDKFTIRSLGMSPKRTTEVYPELNKWYCLELYVKVAAGTGELKLWIDGTLRISNIGFTNTGAGAQVDRTYCGSTYSYNIQHDLTIYGDSYIIDTSYIGPEEEPPPPEAYFSDGFESGDFSAWNGTKRTGGGTTSVVNTDPHHGIYHAEFTVAGSQMWEKAYSYILLNATYNTIYVRGYYKFLDSLPTTEGATMICSPNLRNLANDKAACYLDVKRYSGINYWRLYYMSGDSSTTKISDSEVSLNTWYCVEVYAKIHGSEGVFSVWIEGERIIHVTGLDNDYWGGIDYIQLGERASGELTAHKLRLDCVVVDDSYIGPEGEPPPLKGEWAVVGNVAYEPDVNNILLIFEEQNIAHTYFSMVEISSYDVIGSFDGLVVFTDAGTVTYNVAAIKQFASSKPVLVNTQDFCKKLYPSLSGSMSYEAVSTINYTQDFGAFKIGDEPVFNNDMQDQVFGVDVCLWSALNALGNVTEIAEFSATYSVYWRMAGSGGAGTGFWCIDLNAVASDTLYAGTYHVFPVIELVSEVKPGVYGRWLANGVDHLTLDEVMTWCTDWVAAAPSSMNVSWVKIGTSVSARDINATFIGNGSRYIILDGCIHGNEKFATTTTLAFLEEIETSYSASGIWKDRLAEVTLIVVPVVNPDGYHDNHRANDNGKDLNRQFPPGGTTTEPEAWALRWLWGNYTPVLYLNLHEGKYMEPNTVIYSNYMPTSPNDVKGFTKTNCYNFRDKFEDLNHWGTFTEGGLNKDIGKCGQITYGGITSMAIQGCSYLHGSSAVLLECIAWSSPHSGTNHKARQMMYAMDWYVTFNYEMISQYDRLVSDEFAIVTNGQLKSFTFSNNVTKAELDMTGIVGTSSTKIDIGAHAKPLEVKIDAEIKDEGDGWSYSNGIVTVSTATFRIELSWQPEEPEPEPGTLTSPYVTVTLTAFAIGGGSTLAYYGYRKHKKEKKTVVD